MIFKPVEPVYDRLTVTKYMGNGDYLCTCICGNTRLISGARLRAPGRKSCGCFRKDQALNKVHNNRSYNVWIMMNQRCNNIKYTQYKDYGGRGITVCERWKRFKNFLADMGEQPIGLELDRKDNDKGYSKSNCRWVTHKVNCNNRRNSIRISFNGESLTIKEWADKLGILGNAIWSRHKRGLPVEQVLVTKVGRW